MKTDIDQLLLEYAQVKQQMQEKLQTVFKKTLNDFFQTNPGVTAVVWRQYTPYFNDGDPCEFQVHDPTFTNAPDPENVGWGEYNGEHADVWASEDPESLMSSKYEWDRNNSAALLKCGGVDFTACKDLSELIVCSDMNDVMLAMFGDHALVVATAGGINVSEFNHD